MGRRHAAGAIANPARIEELESIRGLAAILVVFYHIPKWNSWLDIGIINNGYLMVELFFVLSGFVMYNAYGDKITDLKDLIRFQFLRLGRLYPVHLLFLLAFLLIELAKYFAQLRFGISSANAQPFRENNVTALLQQIVLIQAIGPTHNALTFNTPAWSISVEFYTYFVFGAGILFLNRRRNILFLLLASISLVLLATGATFGFENLLRCLAGFFIGCLTAVAMKKIRVSIPSYASLLVLLAITAFLQLKTSMRYDLMIHFLSAALIATLAGTSIGYLNRMLSLRVLTWLGSISYAIYMSFAAVLWATNQVVRYLSPRPERLVGGQSIPQLSAVEALIACVTFTLLVLAVASLVYRFIEKPLRERSRRFARSSLT